ncbi:MAG TPA: lipase family protein [Candidatus Limnocylindrales bacterium]
MIERDDFGREIAGWLADDAGDEAPAYLDAVLGRVARTRQRPSWAAIPGWRPVERTLRGLQIAPALLLVLLGLLLLGIIGTAIVGSRQPPPGPLIALPPLGPVPSASPSPPPLEALRAAQLRFTGSDFYDIPSPLARRDAGAIEYLQPIGDVSSGRAYRVLYHSRSVSGRDVAVSGTIWIPSSSPPPGGYPIVSFGMDNDGSGDMCAMSRADPASTDASWGGLMTLLLGEGHVVAFSDYEGWGTSDPYPLAVLDSSAHSVLDAARASRDLLGAAASDRVVLMGYGLGADATTTAAERAASYAPDLDVRGVIADDGGGADYEAAVRVFAAAGASSGPPTAILQAAAGFSVAYPELRPEDILTPLGLEDIGRLESTCWTQFDQLVSGQTADDVLAVNPLDVPRWARRIKAMTVPRVPVPTFLIVTGEVGPDSDMRRVAARFCRGNEAVLLRGYPEAMIGARDAGRDPAQGVYIVSWPDVRSWLADRFAGAPPIGNCDR